MCQRFIALNPRTVAEYRCDPEGHFVQMFVALVVSIHEFNMGFRPIIVIDSSHMSGLYKGVIFSTSTYDADNGFFPLVYGLFLSENYENWLWFLQKLKIVIGETEVVIISDKHQGIIRSVSKVFGSEFHAHCYRHVKENFGSVLTKVNTRGRKGKENALQMLDRVAYARLETEYNIFVFFVKHMDKVGTLLGDHHSKILIWKWCFGPRTQENIVANIARGEMHITHAFLGGLIKVTIGFAYHEVDFPRRICICRSWKMSSLPCDYACAVCIVLVVIL